LQNDKNTIAISKRSHPIRPPQLIEIRTWGSKWKPQIDKTIEWVAWQWANAKIDKESLTLFKQIIKIWKEDMEDYHWAMFTHAMDFFQEQASLKKPIPKH
jgi:hypothetical protein